MKSYSLCILGCKVNEYEANFLSNMMDKKYIRNDFDNPSDVSIIYTCCVTNIAESKTRKMIRKARRLNPNAFIVAVGCLVQVKNNDEIFNECDLVIGSTLKDKIHELIDSKTKGVFVKQIKDFENLEIDTPFKTRSYLKVEDGCNSYCSFCIIPYSRGSVRSLDFNLAVAQAYKLAKTSKEIVITGIHTGQYNSNGKYLYDLLLELTQIENLHTIRLSSIEINELNDNIINLIASNSKMGLNLHIPCQSLHDDILNKMNRNYTYQYFKDRVEYIRSKIKDISISTDLIVGFPYESDEIFEIIKDRILNEIKFSFIHCFPYSKKQGTPASNMENQVDPQVKKLRVKQILDIDYKLRLDYQSKFLNKEIEVLIEKNLNDFSYGYSKQYFYVKIKGIYEIGTVLKVKLINCQSKISEAICI